MQTIIKYFPHLSTEQQSQFAALDELYHEWNAKINVISRKDIDHLYLHHVLHSLAIAKLIRFKPGTRILDFGTGGGFPGIPLAIMFPECQFRMIDGTGKKIKVVNEVASAVGLNNVEALHRRGEEEKDRFDFVVSRAVMPLPELVRIIKKNISKTQHNALPNGVIALKGGELSDELKPYGKRVVVTPISDYFSEEWFSDKQVVYLPL
jgi:16S rRNA (guanine527-N7)-methyltransferase